MANTRLPSLARPRLPGAFGIAAGNQRYAIPVPPEDRLLHPTDPTYGEDWARLGLVSPWTIRTLTASKVTFPQGGYGYPAARVVFDTVAGGLLRPAPAGDFEVIAALRTTSKVRTDYGDMVALAVLSSAGAGVGCSSYNDGAAYQWVISGFQYSSTGPTMAAWDTGAGYPAAGTWHWVSLRKSGTNYTSSWSANGIDWVARTTATVSAITPASIGIIRLFSNVGSVTLDIGRFNVYFPSFVP